MFLVSLLFCGVLIYLMYKEIRLAMSLTKLSEEDYNIYDLAGTVEAAVTFLKDTENNLKRQGWTNIRIDFSVSGDEYNANAYIVFRGERPMTEKEIKEYEKENRKKEEAKNLGISLWEYETLQRFRSKGIVK